MKRLFLALLISFIFISWAIPTITRANVTQQQYNEYVNSIVPPPSGPCPLPGDANTCTRVTSYKDYKDKDVKDLKKIGTCNTDPTVPCDYSVCDMVIVFINITKLIIQSIGGITLLFFMYAALLFITAAGNTEQVAKGRKVLRTSVIGLLIVMFAYQFVGFLLAVLLGNFSATTTQTKPPSPISDNWASIASFQKYCHYTAGAGGGTGGESDDVNADNSANKLIPEQAKPDEDQQNLYIDLSGAGVNFEQYATNQDYEMIFHDELETNLETLGFSESQISQINTQIANNIKNSILEGYPSVYTYNGKTYILDHETIRDVANTTLMPTLFKESKDGVDNSNKFFLLAPEAPNSTTYLKDNTTHKQYRDNILKYTFNEKEKAKYLESIWDEDDRADADKYLTELKTSFTSQLYKFAKPGSTPLSTEEYTKVVQAINNSTTQ